MEHPEWMFINYDGDNWHDDRNKIAKEVMNLFNI